MKKHLWVGLSAVLVLAVMSGVSWARTYKIAVLPWAGWSPVHVADARGFFKDQGVDVKIFNFPNTDAMKSAFSNKLVDVCFEMIGTAVGWRMEGLPLVIVAETDWSHGGDKIIVKRDATPGQLKGKPIGAYHMQPSIAFFLNRYLISEGLKLTDVRVMEMETAQLADKFIEGLFQMIVSYDPDALRAERQGNGKVVATSATYEGCIPEGMFVLEETLASVPREDWVKIFKAWAQAVRWTQDPANWKEYTTILNGHTFKSDKPYPEEDLKEMVNAVKIHDAASQLERNRDGGGLETYLKNLKAFLTENNLLKQDFDPEKIFRNDAVVEALTVK